MALIAMMGITVTYKCTLSEEDEAKIYEEYLKDTNLSIADTIMKLQYEGKIDVYKDSVENDFYTKCILSIYRKDEKSLDKFYRV